MKQKIIIKVHMRCEKCRSKALKVAAVANGTIESVAIEGSEKDKVVVIGEQVDAVCLTSSLRKKLGHAEIVSIGEVKPPPKPEEKKKPEEPKKPEESKKLPENPVLPIHYIEYPRRCEQFVIIDEYPKGENCCQM